jgi:hypothetical protein
MHVQLSPCFSPLCPFFIMSCTLHHVFWATMGYLPWLFPILQKTFIIHPILITYYEISNNQLLEVDLFIIPFSHLNQNVMWNVIFLINRWIWFITLKQENFRVKNGGKACVIMHVIVGTLNFINQKTCVWINNLCLPQQMLILLFSSLRNLGWIARVAPFVVSPQQCDCFCQADCRFVIEAWLVQ